MNTKNLADRVLKKISSHEHYDEVMKVVRKNAYGKIFLVGGKVYRTAIEVMHNYYCQSESSDWDFLVLGDIKTIHIPQDWQTTSGYYEKKNSVRIIRRGKKTQLKRGPYRYFGRLPDIKIDLISIKDIMKTAGESQRGNVKDYFRIVPLDIQALALDVEKKSLLGSKAVSAIKSRKVSVNNSIGALPGLNISEYIQNKASSIAFMCEQSPRTKSQCDCFSGDIKTLWDRGCQLPQHHI